MCREVQVSRKAWMPGATSEAISHYGISQLEIASSLRAASGTAQAGLSIAWRSHLLHASRGTCTPMYIGHFRHPASRGTCTSMYIGRFRHPRQLRPALPYLLRPCSRVLPRHLYVHVHRPRNDELIRGSFIQNDHFTINASAWLADGICGEDVNCRTCCVQTLTVIHSTAGGCPSPVP